MGDPDPAVLAWCILALASAGVVKGISGIGVPLVGISLLTVVLSVPQAVLLLPVPIILANVWQSFTSGYFIATCRRFWMLFLGLALGVTAGAAALTRVGEGPLMVSLGCIVLAFASATLLEFRIDIPKRREALASTAAGAIGGVFGGMSSIFGPPIIMLLVSLRLTKDAFVGTVATIYLLCGIIMTIAFAGHGALDTTQMAWSTAAAVPLFLGMLAGNVLRRRVGETAFRKGLLLLLLLVGANLIRRGLSGS